MESENANPSKEKVKKEEGKVEEEEGEQVLLITCNALAFANTNT